MKKYLSILLILVFVLGLIPVNISKAITQNQIDAEVQIVCTDGANWFSGSGTIINPKGIILTNRHVVEGAYKDTCFIGFIEEINQEPNFGSEGNYNLAEVKYKTTTDDMDAAILYLDNSSNKTYPYVNIWDSNSDSLKFGDKIEAIGFPSIGGATITYTSGDFSGFGSSSDGTQNYIKTTAPLEHGNSGGGAYNKTGDFIGIPSMVVTGTLNSISYILSVNSLKNWLSGILGNSYKQEIIIQEPEIKESAIDIQNDIMPPNIADIQLQFYDCSQYFPEEDSAGNVQHYPTIKGVQGNALTILKPEQCTPISYNFENSFSYDPQTLYVRLLIPENILSDINTMGDWWSNEPLKRPLEIQNIASGSKIELTYHNGFFKPHPNLNNGEGYYYYSLQIADRAGNVSSTKTWKYYYKQKKDIILDTTGFAKKLSGQILLQVESKGEAYYIYPDDSKKYYLGRPADAFNAMRKLGLGATHEFITSHTIYPDHVLGKILLDVEDQGKAYYIYPKDKKAYYLGKPADAFKVMRELGLGITNNDLNKIQEGSL